VLLCDGNDVQQPVGAALVGDVLCAIGIQDRAIDAVAIPVLRAGGETWGNVGTDGTFPATSRRMAPDLAPDTWGHTSVSVTDYFRRTPMRLAYETRRFASGNVGTDGTFPATSRRMAPDLAPDTWGHTSVSVTDYFRQTPMRLAYETRRFAFEEYQIARSSFQEPFQKQRLPGLFWHGAAFAAR